MSAGLKHVGLCGPREETPSSRQALSLAFSGQWRIACSNVSGAESHREHVVSGCSWYQEGCAAR